MAVRYEEGRYSQSQGGYTLSGKGPVVREEELPGHFAVQVRVERLAVHALEPVVRVANDEDGQLMVEVPLEPLASSRDLKPVLEARVPLLWGCWTGNVRSTRFYFCYFF